MTPRSRGTCPAVNGTLAPGATCNIAFTTNETLSSGTCGGITITLNATVSASGISPATDSNTISHTDCGGCGDGSGGEGVNP